MHLQLFAASQALTDTKMLPFMPSESEGITGRHPVHRRYTARRPRGESTGLQRSVQASKSRN